MEYKGKNNTTCPVCGAQFKYGHPIMYRVDNINTHGHIWCDKCFLALYSQYTCTRESEIEKFQTLIKDTVDKAYATITDRTFPAIAGFWFCHFNNRNLGLVINYSQE